MYLELRRKAGLAALKKLLAKEIHAEARLGSREQARHYCMKPVQDCTCEHCATEPERVAGPWEAGTWSEAGQGKRTDLTQAIDLLKTGATMHQVALAFPAVYVRAQRGLAALQAEIAEPRTNPPEVYICYGPPGCGKSVLSRKTSDPENTWVDPLGTGSWFDGYSGQDVAIFDDFDGAMSHWRLKDLLKALDRYALRVPVKGSFTIWKPTKIWLTTNYHPRSWWDWTAREPQYPALQRRVTRVYHWRENEEEPIVIDPNGRPDLWQYWWAGPPQAQAPTLGPLDEWVEHTAGEPFNFIRGSE